MAQLPSELREQLQRAVSDVFEKAWDALGSRSSAPTTVEDILLSSARDAVVAAARQKYAAISQAAQLENARSSWLNRLPNELWCHIWEHLPFIDRYATSHVCSQWREALSALPHLWTDLHFYVYDVKPGRTPAVRSVPGILALSHALPLDVTIDIEGELLEQNAFGGLMRAFRPHAPRIERLCVRSERNSMLNVILRHFDALPALRSLVLERLPEPSLPGRAGMSDFWALWAELPALERITLGSGFAFNWPFSGHRLLTVRELDLTPRESGNIEVGAALACCTELDALRLDMRAYKSASHASPDTKLCAVAVRVPSVKILSLCRSNETWAMRAFSNSSRRELMLDYPLCEATSIMGWYILGDLLRKQPADDVNVFVGYDTKKRFSVRGIASDGRVRSVSVAVCTDPCIFLNRITDILGFSKCRLKVTIDKLLRDHVSTVCSSNANPEAQLAIEAMGQYR